LLLNRRMAVPRLLERRSGAGRAKHPSRVVPSGLPDVGED
jgi:hypothetical protein